MSDSAASKEVAVENHHAAPEMGMGDVEMGDKGILTQSAPLARELRSRHLQMIAVGKNTIPALVLNNCL